MDTADLALLITGYLAFIVAGYTVCSWIAQRIEERRTRTAIRRRLDDLR